MQNHFSPLGLSSVAIRPFDGGEQSLQGISKMHLTCPYKLLPSILKVGNYFKITYYSLGIFFKKNSSLNEMKTIGKLEFDARLSIPDFIEIGTVQGDYLFLFCVKLWEWDGFCAGNRTLCGGNRQAQSHFIQKDCVCVCV